MISSQLHKFFKLQLESLTKQNYDISKNKTEYFTDFVSAIDDANVVICKLRNLSNSYNTLYYKGSFALIWVTCGDTDNLH